MKLLGKLIQRHVNKLMEKDAQLSHKVIENKRALKHELAKQKEVKL